MFVFQVITMFTKLYLLLNSIKGCSQVYFVERSFFSDRIFTEATFSKYPTSISKKNFETYISIQRTCMDILSRGSTVLILLCDSTKSIIQRSNECRKRIAIRGRSGEEKISLAYLCDLDARHWEFFENTMIRHTILFSPDATIDSANELLICVEKLHGIAGFCKKTHIDI